MCSSDLVLLVVIVMMAVLVLFVMVVMAAMVMLLIIMMMVVLLFLVLGSQALKLHFGKLRGQGGLALHSGQQLLARQLRPGGGDNGSHLVMLPQHGHGGIQLRLGNGVGPALVTFLASPNHFLMRTNRNLCRSYLILFQTTAFPVAALMSPNR